MVQDNDRYYFQENCRIGCSAAYDNLNKAMSEARTRDDVEDVRIGPPLEDKSKLYTKHLSDMVGLYVRTCTKHKKMTLEQAFQLVDNA